MAGPVAGFVPRRTVEALSYRAYALSPGSNYNGANDNIVAGPAYHLPRVSDSTFISLISFENGQPTSASALITMLLQLQLVAQKYRCRW